MQEPPSGRPKRRHTLGVLIGGSFAVFFALLSTPIAAHPLTAVTTERVILYKVADDHPDHAWVWLVEGAPLEVVAQTPDYYAVMTRSGKRGYVKKEALQLDGRVVEAAASPPVVQQASPSAAPDHSTIIGAPPWMNAPIAYPQTVYSATTGRETVYLPAGNGPVWPVGASVYLPAPRPQFTFTPIRTATPTPYLSDIDEMLALINAERAEVGAAALQTNALVNQAAALRAQEAAVLFDHTRPDGSSFRTALDDVGCPWSAAGENLSKGPTTVEGAFRQLMHAAPHRALMLDPTYETLGLAHAADVSDAWTVWALILIR